MKISSQLMKMAKVSGAYFATTKDGAVYLSGGGNPVQVIDIVFHGEQAAITIGSINDEPVEIIRGHVFDVMSGYLEFVHNVVAPKDKLRKLAVRFFATVSFAAVMAFVGFSYSQYQQKLEFQQMVESDEDFARYIALATGQPLAPKTDERLLPPAQPSPSQLKVPGDQPMLSLPLKAEPEAAPFSVPEIANPQSDNKASERVVSDSPFLPSYTPDLYIKPAKTSTEDTTAAPKIDPVAADRALEAVEEPAVKAIETPASAEGANEPTPTAPEAKDEEVKAPEPTADEPAKAEEAKTDAHTEEPVTDAKLPVSQGVATSEVTQSDVKKDEPAKAATTEVNKTVGTLLDKGMTPYQAMDVLKQLEQLSSADLSEITPEMLSSLPHEIAHMLTEQGLVDPNAAGPDGVPYSIIRLPDEVMTKFKGEDGIFSIPEANSWAARGNSVTIPLPGGGDIKTPEDMKAFGLQP